MAQSAKAELAKGWRNFCQPRPIFRLALSFWGMPQFGKFKFLIARKMQLGTIMQDLNEEKT